MSELQQPSVHISKLETYSLIYIPDDDDDDDDDSGISQFFFCQQYINKHNID